MKLEDAIKDTATALLDLAIKDEIEDCDGDFYEHEYPSVTLSAYTKDIEEEIKKLIDQLNPQLQSKISIAELLEADEDALWLFAMGPGLGHGIGPWDGGELTALLESHGFTHDTVELYKGHNLQGAMLDTAADILSSVCTDDVRREIIKRAKENYQSDDIVIIDNNDPEDVDRTEDGYWVKARVWIPKE